MAKLEGRCEPRFEAVRGALAEHLDSGEELGASLVVDVDGDLVVDLWGGFCDHARTVPWTERTITNVWSSTKTVTSLAALMLADRGELDVDAPVARYWPEFAAGGKEGVLVRHLLSHSSGVSGLEQPAVAEEIAGPLGADFQIGAAEADWGRIADVVPPPPLPIDFEALGPDSLTVKTLTGPFIEADAANTPEWRRADLGAVNGHGNARSVARVMSVVARGGQAGGFRLLRPETIEKIFIEQVNGIDLVLGVPLRFGIGYGLPVPVLLPWIPDEKICYWGGWGGSMIIMDTGRRMTISYMMNKMGPGIIGSDRSAAYGQAIYDALAT